MMPLSLVPEVLDLELLSVSQKPDSELPAFQNCSQPDPTQSPLKEVSTLPLVICTMMTGDGISMILSRVVIGSEIKMPFTI